MLAGGTREKGPFFPNPSSKATTYTLLDPGTDGGLRTGSYQPAPTPAFNVTGDALANRIIAPQRFAFIQYSAQTSPIDPQTGANVPAPSISVTPDGKLSGQLQAFVGAVEQAELQRRLAEAGRLAARPDEPGHAARTTPTTKAYTLEWTSQIVGGRVQQLLGGVALRGDVRAGLRGVSDAGVKLVTRSRICSIADDAGIGTTVAGRHRTAN